MNESEFLDLLTTVRSESVVTKKHNATIDDFDLDSLELLELWCHLEGKLGERFHPKTTLRQIFEMVQHAD